MTSTNLKRQWDDWDRLWWVDCTSLLEPADKELLATLREPTRGRGDGDLESSSSRGVG
jgi:hypothetical protein